MDEKNGVDVEWTVGGSFEVDATQVGQPVSQSLGSRTFDPRFGLSIPRPSPLRLYPPQLCEIVVGGGLGEMQCGDTIDGRNQQHREK